MRDGNCHEKCITKKLDKRMESNNYYSEIILKHILLLPIKNLYKNQKISRYR